jgi:hypothetical protein
MILTVLMRCSISALECFLLMRAMAWKRMCSATVMKPNSSSLWWMNAVTIITAMGETLMSAPYQTRARAVCGSRVPAFPRVGMHNPVFAVQLKVYPSLVSQGSSRCLPIHPVT